MREILKDSGCWRFDFFLQRTLCASFVNNALLCLKTPWFFFSFTSSENTYSYMHWQSLVDWLLCPGCALVPLIRLYEHAIPHPTPQRDISTSYSTVKLKCSVEVICRSHHTLVSVFSRRGVGWVGSGSSNPANVSQSYQQFSRLSLLFITIPIKRQIKEGTKSHFSRLLYLWILTVPT